MTRRRAIQARQEAVGSGFYRGTEAIPRPFVVAVVVVVVVVIVVVSIVDDDNDNERSRDLCRAARCAHMVSGFQQRGTRSHAAPNVGIAVAVAPASVKAQR